MRFTLPFPPFLSALGERLRNLPGGQVISGGGVGISALEWLGGEVWDPLGEKLLWIPFII